MERYLSTQNRRDLYSIADAWKESENVDTQAEVFEALSAFTKLFLSRLGNTREDLDQDIYEKESSLNSTTDVPKPQTESIKVKSETSNREISKPDSTLHSRRSLTEDVREIRYDPETRNFKLHDYNPRIIPVIKHRNNPILQREETESENQTLADVVKIGSDKMTVKEVIRVFDNDVVCSGVDFSHPTFFGLVPSSGHLLYSAGEFLSNISHVVPLGRFISSGVCNIEYSVLRWVCDIIGYPEQARGVTVSGTSMGAVLAYATVRHVRISERSQYSRSVVYMTEFSHFCNTQALQIVGLTDAVIRRVQIRNYRMDAKCLDELIKADKEAGLSPFMVIGTMGTTSLGAVDPIGEIARLAQKHSIWFHVDAAIGGFLLLDESVKDRTELSMADSITLDFHKGLSAPFGTAAILMRDGSHLKSAMARGSASYMPDSGIEPDYSPSDFTFEVTRPFRAFPIWFMLKILGTENMKTAITEKIKLTKYAYESIRDLPNVVTCMDPDLTVIAFRYVPEDGENGNESTRKWHELITEEGIACLTTTTVDGLFYIRMCILSLRSHIDAVDATLLSIQRNLELIPPNKTSRALHL